MRVGVQVTIDATLQVYAATLYNTRCVTPLFVGSQLTLVTLQDIHADRCSKIPLRSGNPLIMWGMSNKGTVFVV